MNTLYITLSESDLGEIFAINKSNHPFDYKKPILMFLGLFIVLFIGMNFPAFLKSATFHRPKKIIIPEAKAEAKQPQYSESHPNNVVVVNEPNDRKPINTDIMKNNEIYIPSVNIKAPVNWNVAFDEQSIQLGLRTGVIQINGTSLPGEVGNIFISGHSSYLPFVKGDYKEIFATLPNVKLGDRIYIIRGGTLYTYQVDNIFETKPSNIEVMKQTNDSILTLSTCVPIGTASRRFIVQSKQIAPDPQKNQAFSGTTLNLNGQIPAS